MTERKTNKGIDSEREDRSVGRTGHNGILTPLKISQRTQQRSRETPTPTMPSSLYDKTKKQSKNSKTPQRKGTRA